MDTIESIDAEPEPIENAEDLKRAKRPATSISMTQSALNRQAALKSERSEKELTKAASSKHGTTSSFRNSFTQGSK